MREHASERAQRVSERACVRACAKETMVSITTLAHARAHGSMTIRIASRTVAGLSNVNTVHFKSRP